MLDCIKVIKGVNKRIKQTRGDLEVYEFSQDLNCTYIKPLKVALGSSEHLTFGQFTSCFQGKIEHTKELFFFYFLGI